MDTLVRLETKVNDDYCIKCSKNIENSIAIFNKKLYYILIGLYRSIGMYMRINKNDEGGKTLVRN